MKDCSVVVELVCRTPAAIVLEPRQPLACIRCLNDEHENQDKEWYPEE